MFGAFCMHLCLPKSGLSDTVVLSVYRLKKLFQFSEEYKTINLVINENWQRQHLQLLQGINSISEPPFILNTYLLFCKYLNYSLSIILQVK